jgi:outer membrane biosynthesis protein TonB
MTIDLPVTLQPDGFGATLQALHSSLQGFLSEYEDKVAQARAQLAHVEALLGTLPAEAPKTKAKKKEVVAVAPVVAPAVAPVVIAEVPPAPTKGRKPKAAAKPEVAPAAKGRGRGHRRGSLTTRPAYDGLTLTEAIEKILNERQGQAVNADDVVNILYGDLTETVFRVAKERVTKNLSKGKGEDRWKRVPNQLGYYTLSLETLKTVPISTIKRGRAASVKTEAPAPKAAKAPKAAPKTAAKAAPAPKAIKAPKATKAPKAVATKAPKAVATKAPKATPVKAAPKASKKAEVESKASQPKKSGRMSSLVMRPLYQGNTLTDAIEKVLQERKGEFVNADSVVKALYGDLSAENFRQAKDRVTKNLSKGKLDGKWERVPNQLGYYTLSMSAVKA